MRKDFQTISPDKQLDHYLLYMYCTALFSNNDLNEPVRARWRVGEWVSVGLVDTLVLKVGNVSAVV